MPGEGNQVCSKGSDINALVGYRLGGINHHDRAHLMGFRRYVSNGIAGTQHVAHMRYGHHLGAIVDQIVAFSRLKIEPALIRDVEPAERGAGLLADKLPRNNV